MKINDLKQRVIVLQNLVIILFLFIVFYSIVLYFLNDRIEEWRHVIDFLKIWIRQNDLQITPTDSI